MSTSLGRGRGARVKLDSKVGRVGTTTTMTTTTAMKKLNPGVTHPTPAPSQVVFPSSQGSDLSLPLTVIQALKSGCVTIEKLLELSSFLLSHGSALEETHGDVLAELIRCLRSYVHSPNIPAARVRSTRLAIIRLLEIRQQGWVTAPSADAFYKQHIAQLAETSEISNSSGNSVVVTPRDQESRPSSSLSNHESAKKPPQDEAWESLGVSVRDDVQAEESAFIEANNATGTPAVQQFNCIPLSLQGADSPIAAVPEADPVNGPGLIEQSSALPRQPEQEPGRSGDSTETLSGDVGLGPLPTAPPMTISTANLHSRYLTNQKGQMLIISACSPLIVGMAENILLRQIPTLQSMPTSLEMVTKPKRAMKDNSAQCDLLHDKSFGSLGATTSSASPAPPVNLAHSASSVTSAPSATVDLFVRHLHESVDDRALFGAFEPFDDLVNARVQTDDDGYSKGYGFVSFASLEAANVAVAAMNGAELRTKRLFVDLAKRKEDVKQTERDVDDHQNKPVYSHFSKPAYQRSKSEVPSSGRSANRQIDDPLFDDTDICGVEEFGAIDSGTPAPARPAREAPPRETGGVKWHVTGKSRGVAPPMARDSQERALSSMRVSHDPRGRYCDEDEDEAAEEDSGRRSRSPDSPRVPVVIGPWLKMAADFADKKDANGDSDDFVGDAQPMEKLLRDIPSTGETDRYRQFLLALSLSPLSQEPPLENWEIYCRQQNDCCVECMTEAFNPLRYLDYWERTSPQERCNRRPAYEEHDNRKAVYEEHDHRKVDYAKIYGPPKPPVHRQRSNPERFQESFSGVAPRAQHSPADEETPPYAYNKAPPGYETSDLTLVTTLESMNETSIRPKSPRVSVPPGFENQSQSTILCEDQLTALMMSTDFEDDFDRSGGGDTLRNKVLSSTADDNLLVNVSAVTEEMKKFDFSQS